MPDGGTGIFAGGLVVGLVVLFITFVPLWKIVSKTGYPGIMSLLFFVPVLNLVMIFVLAFSKWPIEQRLEELRRSQA